MSGFGDLTGYWDDSWDYDEPSCKTLGEILATPEEPIVRWPVRNREPRTPISSQKRAIIHERDGGYCRYCLDGSTMLVVDHIIPRSAFMAEDLAAADRSDNLQSACFPCNEQRSNYTSYHRKRLGVVIACFYCVNPEYLDETLDPPVELPHPVNVNAFCGRCGISAVPQIEGWVL